SESSHICLRYSCANWTAIAHRMAVSYCLLTAWWWDLGVRDPAAVESSGDADREFDDRDGRSGEVVGIDDPQSGHVPDPVIHKAQHPAVVLLRGLRVRHEDGLGGTAVRAKLMDDAVSGHEILLDQVAQGEAFAKKRQVPIPVRLARIRVVDSTEVLVTFIND